VGPNHRVMSEAREARIGVFLGPLDEDGVALVAFLVRQGHATNIAECQHLRCTGLLWQHFGCTPIRLYNLYGDATGSLDGKLETGALARSALVDAEGAGAVPSILAGDFNMTFAELPCLHALVASNWHDLGSSVTSAPSHGCSRRIDLLIANAGARAVGTSTRVDWSLGMPTHAAQYIDISDSPAPSCPKWLAPKTIPPSLPLVKPSDAWSCVPLRLMVQVKEAAARDDINGAWKLFLECLEYHFTALSGVPCNLVDRKGMVEQRKPSAQVIPGGDAASARLSHAVRRARRLRGQGLAGCPRSPSVPGRLPHQCPFPR